MRIACVLGPGFEDSEFKQPYDEFRRAGHEVIIVGIKKGESLDGKRGREKALVDVAVTDVEADQFDALFIPGGHSPDALRAHPRMVDFVRDFRDKPILAICHGPQLLVAADMLEGRKVTAWKTIQDDLRRMDDIDVVDVPVCTDDNLVTSRQPEDIPAFVRESLRVLQSYAADRQLPA